jgi:hypothetical protein
LREKKKEEEKGTEEDTCVVAPLPYDTRDGRILLRLVLVIAYVR